MFRRLGAASVDVEDVEVLDAVDREVVEADAGTVVLLLYGAVPVDIGIEVLLE